VDLCGSELGPAVGFCTRSNELPDCVQCVAFRHCVSNCLLTQWLGPAVYSTDVATSTARLTEK
jgi:hypothetical protein